MHCILRSEDLGGHLDHAILSAGTIRGGHREISAARIAVRSVKLTKVVNIVIGHSCFGPYRRSAENDRATLQKYFSYR